MANHSSNSTISSSRDELPALYHLSAETTYSTIFP